MNNKEGDVLKLIRRSILLETDILDKSIDGVLLKDTDNYVFELTFITDYIDKYITVNTDYDYTESSIDIAKSISLYYYHQFNKTIKFRHGIIVDYIVDKYGEGVVLNDDIHEFQLKVKDSYKADEINTFIRNTKTHNHKSILRIITTNINSLLEVLRSEIIVVNNNQSTSDTNIIDVKKEYLKHLNDIIIELSSLLVSEEECRNNKLLVESNNFIYTLIKKSTKTIENVCTENIIKDK